MRYFVTGATGFLGSHLVGQLVSQGDQVVALVYEPDRESALQEMGAETIVGGFDGAVLREGMSGCDGVFHVAGYVDLDDTSGRRSNEVNVEGPRAVCAAALDVGVKRLVHTASLVTIGHSLTDEVLTEASPQEFDDLSLAYIRTKREGERIALSHVERGLEVVVCNPSGIIGPDDRWGSQANVIFERYLRNSLPVVPVVRNNWGDVRDIAAGEILAMQNGRSGERYFLGSENTSLAELLGKLDAALDRPRKRRRTFGWPLTYGIGALTGAFRRKPVISRHSARFIRRAFWVSHEKAVGELGYAPRPIAETLRDTARWFAE